MPKLVLYHGTAASALPRILKEGLLPRNASDHAGNYDEDHIKSHPDLVYLTSHYAGFYGMISAGKVSEDEPVAIVRVEVDSRRLFPDEDLIRAALKLPAKDAPPHPRDYKKAWQTSLTRMGTVASEPVSPKKITGHVVLPQDFMFFSHLGADANNVSIAMWVGCVAFDKFKRRTELLFEGGRDAVLRDVEEEYRHNQQQFEIAKLLPMRRKSSYPYCVYPKTE